MRKILCLLMVCTWTSFGVSQEGLYLAPGETLLSIDGVAVQGPSTLVVGQISSYGNLGAYEVNKDAAAYAHAKREAELQASRGRMGHLLGTAPGCRYSGVGMSSGSQPRHCYSNWPASRLIARASATRNGRTYWSAHYR